MSTKKNKLRKKTSSNLQNSSNHGQSANRQKTDSQVVIIDPSRIRSQYTINGIQYGYSDYVGDKGVVDPKGNNISNPKGAYVKKINNTWIPTRYDQDAENLRFYESMFIQPKESEQSVIFGFPAKQDFYDNYQIAPSNALYDPYSPAYQTIQEVFERNSKARHAWRVSQADAKVRATAPSNHPFQMAAGVGVGTLLSLGYLTNPFGTTAALMAFPYGNQLFNDIWSGTAPYGYVHQNVPTEFRSGTWNEDVSRGLQGLGMQKDNADLVAEFSNPGGLTISGLAAKAARPLDNAYNRWLVNNGHVYKTNNVFRSVIGDLNKESITSSITNLGKNLKSKLQQTYKNFKLKSIQSYLDKISNSDYILSSEELNYLKDNLSKNSSILKDLNFNFRDLPTQVRKLLYDIVEKDGAKTGYVVEPKKKVINRADISLSNGIEDQDIMKLLKPVMSDIQEYKLNPERLQKTREALGWDEQALQDYIEELNLLITLPRGFKILNEPSHLRASLGTTHINPIRQEVMVNKAAISDLDELYEALLHEIGGHGSTGQVSIDHPQMQTRFPRTWEVIQYNDKLSKDLLVPTDRTIRNSKEIFEQVEDLKYHGVSDNEIESLLPFINSNKNYMDYIKRDQELQTRVHTSNMADKVWPEQVSINERSLQQFFTPESIQKLKKAILTISPAIPIGASTDYYKEK